jgi:hypothetical protein
MANNNHGREWLYAVASAALFALSAATAPPASAQDNGTRITVDAAKSVDLRTAPEVPDTPRPTDLVSNRPTIPMADYLAAKNTAAAKPGVARPQPAAAPPSNSTVTLFSQAGSTNQSQTTGGNVLPPNGDIATSANWLVQVNNDVVTMYNWNTNAFVQKKFNTFFQDSTYFKFDPRVIYDPYWDRFAVLVDACNPCSGASTQSFFFLAVSWTGDPTGVYWVWFLGTGTHTGDFADFPQLGMDLNSLIVTYNDFKSNNTLEGRTFSMAKAYLYNNHPLGVSVFGGSSCTVAPPYVLDDSPTAYVLAFCPGDNKVSIGSLINTGLSGTSLHWDKHGDHRELRNPTERAAARGQLSARHRRQPVREPLGAELLPDPECRDSKQQRPCHAVMARFRYPSEPPRPGEREWLVRFAHLVRLAPEHQREQRHWLPARGDLRQLDERRCHEQRQCPAARHRRDRR